MALEPLHDPQHVIHPVRGLAGAGVLVLNDELFVKLEDDSIYAGFRYSWERMTEDEDVYTYP